MFTRFKYTAFFFIILFALTGASGVYAQQFGSNIKEVKSDSTTNTQDEGHQGFKPDVQVTMGTSFSSFGPGFNTLGTYIAPEISLPVNNKFSIQVGMGYSSLFFNQPGETTIGNTNSQYGSLYVSGTYLINDKLSIRGTGYKTFLLNPPPAENTPGTPDFSNQGVAFDVDYKVSDHFHINASFQYRQQNYPQFYYGYPSPGYGAPMNPVTPFGGFGRSPFGY